MVAFRQACHQDPTLGILNAILHLKVRPNASKSYQHAKNSNAGRRGVYCVRSHGSLSRLLHRPGTIRLFRCFSFRASQHTGHFLTLKRQPVATPFQKPSLQAPHLSSSGPQHFDRLVRENAIWPATVGDDVACRRNVGDVFGQVVDRHIDGTRNMSSPVFQRWSNVDGQSGAILDALQQLRAAHRSDRITRAVQIRDRALVDLERALARAHEASEAKTMFLATMSHELRTPMNGVIGSTSLLLQTELDPDQREFVETVRTSAESLRLLVDDVLDFSKLESGKITLQAADTDLRAIVHEVVASLQSRAQDKGLALREFVDAEVPARVHVDAFRVRQVLLHLLGNAIKFTDEGGVTVKVGLDGRDDGRATVRFAVIDTGIGVPKESHATLFEPFTQADGSLSRRHGGTGLGLAICQRIISLMRGTIGFESAPGSGSVFWFTLPVEEVLDRLREVPRPPLPSQPNKVTMRKHAPILLVEDNPVNQRMALHMLRRSGFDAELAENGQVALDKLAKTRFMLVLMDCSMPVMDGFETTRRIRAIESATGEHLPIVALTANAMPGDRERCLEAGMDEYLAKPVTADELRAKIEGFTGRVE